MAKLDVLYGHYTAGIYSEDVFYALLRTVFLRIAKGDEDIAQDAVLSIFQEIRGGKTWTYFSAYANRVVHNITIDRAREAEAISTATLIGAEVAAAGKRPLVRKAQKSKRHATLNEPDIEDVFAWLATYPDPRARHIANAIASGYTNAELGDELGISERQVGRILSKLGRHVRASMGH